MTSLHKNLIGGEWIAGSDVARNVNPSDVSDIVGEYARGDKAQTEQAIAAAKEAFSAWSVSPIQQRHDVLKSISEQNFCQARRPWPVTCA